MPHKVQLSQGEWLRLARERHKLSQDELAEKIGVTRSTVYRYESGTTTIPPHVLKRIKTHLEVGAQESERKELPLLVLVDQDGTIRLRVTVAVETDPLRLDWPRELPGSE